MGQNFCACRNMYSPGLYHVGGLHVENIGNRPKSSQGLPHYISSENRVNMHIAIQLHNIQMVYFTPTPPPPPPPPPHTHNQPSPIHPPQPPHTQKKIANRFVLSTSSAICIG